MYAKQREDESCACVGQRIKRNTQGLRSAWRNIESIYLAYALKGALNEEHVHWMIIVNTSKVTLDELDEMVLNMGLHVDQVIAKEHSSYSWAFVSVKSKREVDYKLDNMTRQSKSLSAALSSSQSPNGRRYEPGSRGRGGGRNIGGWGKENTLLLELWRRSSHSSML